MICRKTQFGRVERLRSRRTLNVRVVGVFLSSIRNVVSSHSPPSEKIITKSKNLAVVIDF